MCNKGGDSLRRLLTAPKICIDEPMDKYTAGIELSNACRQFYVTRVKAAGKVKERLGLCNDGTNSASGSSSADPRQTRDELSSEDETLTTNALGGDADNLKASSFNNSKCAETGKSRIEKAMNALKNEMVRIIFIYDIKCLSCVSNIHIK